MKLKKIKLSKLLKLELAPLIMDVIDVLKKYDVEKLHLEFALKILEKNQKQINTLEILLGPHGLTSEIEKWHRQRLTYAGSVSTQMKGIAQANLQSMSEDIKIAQRVVNDYLVGIRNNNKKEIGALIDNFLAKIDDKPIVESAFTNIGLMPYVDELRNADATHRRLYYERLTSRAKRQKRDESKAIQKEGQAALRSFFEQVSVSDRTYPELNYKPLINELNSVIVDFSNTINTRATYNKKRALKAQEEKDAATSAETENKVQLMCVNEKPSGLMVVKKEKTKLEKPV